MRSLTDRRKMIIPAILLFCSAQDKPVCLAETAKLRVSCTVAGRRLMMWDRPPGLSTARQAGRPIPQRQAGRPILQDNHHASLLPRRPCLCGDCVSNTCPGKEGGPTQVVWALIFPADHFDGHQSGV